MKKSFPRNRTHWTSLVNDAVQLHKQDVFHVRWLFFPNIGVSFQFVFSFARNQMASCPLVSCTLPCLLSFTMQCLYLACFLLPCNVSPKMSFPFSCFCWESSAFAPVIFSICRFGSQNKLCELGWTSLSVFALLHSNKMDENVSWTRGGGAVLSNGGHAHYVIESKVQWEPFWLATQQYPQNDWTGWQWPYSPKGKKWRPRAPGGIMPR